MVNRLADFSTNGHAANGEAKRGFFMITNAAMDRAKGVGAAAFAVYVAIVRHADKHGEAWPGIYRLAEMLDLSPRSVIDHIAKLESAGLIKAKHAPGKSTVYQCKFCTSANFAPVQILHDTSANSALLPVQNLHQKEDPLKEYPRRKTSSEPKSASEQPGSPELNDKIFLTFPTVGRGAKSWILTESKLAEYVESFPGVDVRAECKKALQWCRDNKTKRKTPRGMAAFVTRWMTRQQDRGPPRNETAAHATPTPTDEEILRERAEHAAKKKRAAGFKGFDGFGKKGNHE